MISIDTNSNEKLSTIVDHVNADERLQQYWTCANVMAVDRLGYNDHSEKHVEIVADKALQLLRFLQEDQEPGIVQDYDFTHEDAEVVVLLAALLHDVGHIVHRYNHSEYSLVIANRLLDDLLEATEVYTPREQVVIKSEVLHAIQSHHRKAEPLTLEAGILRVADALDMEKGRASGPDDIHAISALSVDNVSIEHRDAADQRPVLIKIALNNSSGVFQVDHLFKQKVAGSGLEDLIAVRAEIHGDEKHIIDTYEF